MVNFYEKLILSILSTIIICSMLGAQTFAYLPKAPNCYNASALFNAESVDVQKFNKNCECKKCELTIVRFDALNKLIQNKNYESNLISNYDIIWNDQKGAIKSETARDGGLALLGASNILYLVSAAAWAPPVAIGGAVIGGVVAAGGEVVKLIFLSDKEMTKKDIELMINQLQMLSNDIKNKRYEGNNYLQLTINKDPKNAASYSQFMYQDGLNKFYHNIKVDQEMEGFNKQLELILKNYEEGKYNLHAGETYAPWWYSTAEAVRNVTLTGAALLDLALFFNKTGKIPDLKSIQNNLETFGVPAALIKKFADLYKKADKLSKSDKKGFWAKMSEVGEMSIDLNFSDNAESSINSEKLSSNIDKAFKLLDSIKKSAPTA